MARNAWTQRPLSAARGAEPAWRTRSAFALATSMLAACSPPRSTVDSSSPIDAVDIAASDTPHPPVPIDCGPPVACTDADGDGISDTIEGRCFLPAIDTDSDGTPDYLDTDSDNDGISDADEAIRRYAGYESEASSALVCGDSPARCASTEDAPCWRNLDSDSDGVTDHEEVFVYRTDPCRPATHTDPITSLPVSDAIWAAAGGVPPNDGSRYVVLPFAGPSCTPAPQHVRFRFDSAMLIRGIDVFFVVDSTASMGTVLSAMQASLSSSIIPQITAALGPETDLRFGAADFRSFPEAPDGAPGRDYIVHVGQTLTHDASLVQAFVNTWYADGGGDASNPMTEAVYQVLVGNGLNGASGHATDRTVQHGCQHTGTSTSCVAPDLGWASPTDPMRDCGDSTAMGYGCFQIGRLPVIAGVSNADWVHSDVDQCGPGTPCTALSGSSYGVYGHTFEQLSTSLGIRGAMFVGVDTGSGATRRNSTGLAVRTSTLDGTGAPIALMGAPSDVAALVVSGITTAILEMRQEVRCSVEPAPTGLIPPPHTATDFVYAVTPVGAAPEAPIGYDHSDLTTFYGVGRSTVVTFEVDLFNDFLPPSGSLATFDVTVRVLGRSSTVELSRHVFHIVVPGSGCR